MAIVHKHTDFDIHSSHGPSQLWMGKAPEKCSLPRIWESYITLNLSEMGYNAVELTELAQDHV